ncbi:MAG: N-acetylneuraminate synthase family protein, partial [Spirochaetaceae bacterium]|nr:N-acetylneuraminate synthase family protein [Spirochaetaceae bacterium]
VEKHFTLDRSLPGPDHPASLEPDELKRLVIAVRNVTRALGDGVKRPANERECNNRAAARKSFPAGRFRRSLSRRTRWYAPRGSGRCTCGPCLHRATHRCRSRRQPEAFPLNGDRERIPRRYPAHRAPLFQHGS